MLFRSVSKVQLGVCAALTSLILVNATTSNAQQFVIKLKGGAGGFTQELSGLQLGAKLRLLDTHRTGSLVLVDIPAKDQQEVAAQLTSLAAENDLEYIVPNIIFHAFEAPNDTQYSQQWALPKVRAEAAWAINPGNKEVTVAVIDTGVDWTHTEFFGQIRENSLEIPGNGMDDDNNGFVDDVHGWDFKDNDNNPNDETSSKNPGHGTHCAGIIGAAANNGVGISGIAQQVGILPVRFLGSDGSGDLMTAAKAIDYASGMKVDVISASWGAAVPRDQVKPILDAIERAGAQGIVFVAAAANDGKNNDIREVYPANGGFANMISVAASDPQDGKPSWSNYGLATVDLAAPGLDILSTIPKNGYQKLSGTSMATPLVAGSVALVIAEAQARNKNMTPQEIKAILQGTGAKVAIDTACKCRIDVGAALAMVRDNTLVVLPNAATMGLTAKKQFTGFGGKAPFTFASSNPAVAAIGSDGTLTAATKGETTVTVTDSAGAKAASRTIYVGQAAPKDPGGSCPLNPPQLCDILCQIDPSLPWCKK